MDCPNCKEAMVTLELDEVEVDYCIECTGIWLDAGELELLLEGGGGAAEILKSFMPALNCAEGFKKCPICLRKMRKVMVGSGDRAKLIDECKNGDGLWFDRGELQTVLDMSAFNGQSRVRSLLEDIFGRSRDKPDGRV